MLQARGGESVEAYNKEPVHAASGDDRSPDKVFWTQLSWQDILRVGATTFVQIPEAVSTARFWRPTNSRSAPGGPTIQRREPGVETPPDT